VIEALFGALSATLSPTTLLSLTAGTLAGIVGGAIPKEFIPAVEKGIKETMESGVVAGYPMVDARVRLHDGSYHEVDSSEMAFKIAGSIGFKRAIERAKPQVLEPIMHVEVVTPDGFLGDIVGDLGSRRSHIEMIETRPDVHIIRVQVPLAEMFGYATDLRSATQGRGTYSMEFGQYQPVSKDTVPPALARARG